jgi:hypothetical protein
MSDHIPDAGKMVQLDELKARVALHDMNMACIDDIINGDHRNGMTPDTMIVQQVAALKRELREVREWIRKHAPIEDGLFHDCDCDCYECREWRKAVGVEEK